MRITWPRSIVPSMARAFASLRLPPPKAISWSSRLSASRMLPSAARASSASAAGSKCELLGAGDEFQALADQARRQALEAELQAARQHGDRQLLRIGGREQEFDVRRRLLERLQQRVERMADSMCTSSMRYTL
jgi:fructose 1,6-bisphosphatase